MGNSLNISNFKICEWSIYIFGGRNILLISKAMTLAYVIYHYSDFDDNLITNDHI